ncbi:ferredoxin [Melghirimyces profundicolus]|uniref:Ferredoxin n=1 Tax=Melghirimyces profundicolus TaxID=1242148 RepID=A0A2T6C8M3_9BACL|nr:2Fe-2S iron-sulfur cluster-binding protein [Melghirimyces profundicolus]PTX64660.1 ferredoxin [Melghirimyces profundicolus]
MPCIYFASTDKKVEIEEGKESNVLRTSIRYECGIPYRCGGGLCGTCRIRVDEGAENLTEIKKKEVERLGGELLEKGYRLACQSFATGDVKIKWDTSVTVNVPPKLRKYWENKTS